MGKQEPDQEVGKEWQSPETVPRHLGGGKSMRTLPPWMWEGDEAPGDHTSTCQVCFLTCSPPTCWLTSDIPVKYRLSANR